MQLDAIWETMFALGFILASGLFSGLVRHPWPLQWRNILFIVSQSLLAFSVGQSYISDLVPLMCALPILTLSEQVRYLCQPQGLDKKIVYTYWAIIATISLSLLVIPTAYAFGASTALSAILLVCLLVTIHTKDIFQRVHIQLLLTCTLLIVSANYLSLSQAYWQSGSEVIHFLTLLSIAASVFINQWAIYQHAQYEKQHYAHDELPRPVEANSEEHQQILLALSHDMRTPLSGILGMAELLLETPLSPAQREYAQTVQSSGNALLHLLNDRLDVGHAQGQNLTILEEVFDVAELLNYCLDLFKGQADDKNIELVGYLDSALPKQVMGDAVRLRQILSRLVHNAIRFTETGEVVISIKSTIWQNDLGIQFSVQDTGIGMTEQQLITAFVPQVRQDSHNVWHIGPDLSTCQQLVDAMAGQLQLDSSPHEGTMVWFALPLKTPSSVFTDSTTEFIASFAGKRMLVVDDNRTVSKVLAEQATQWGMRVSSAESGTEALAVARNAANLGQAFDVIIMDYQMPGMSGLQLGARLKEDSLITNDVILIMLTGLRQNNIQTLARNAGIHRVISKPVTSKQLRQAISQELKRLQGVKPPELHNTSAQLGRIKVLIAEDNQLSQKVIRGMMQKLGIDHSIVSNGREAVQAVMRDKFDIVLMDCDMPFVDGYSAAQEIRRWEKQEHRQPLPILALTAHILDEQKQKAINSGMNEHLSKPIELGDLQNALLRWT
ncbi:signal transduction histidine kinase [Agitococcus lubricus]|uniref:histidine kinase n=2 Tax=Agitococcus lubricus TaxID=1077255 RepID=A0A2T5IYF1_9GAMM|nr:signal transduction histidine kinase [Agitococcus lubricus]